MAANLPRRIIKETQRLMQEPVQRNTYSAVGRLHVPTVNLFCSLLVF